MKTKLKFFQYVEIALVAPATLLFGPLSAFGLIVLLPLLCISAIGYLLDPSKIDRADGLSKMGLMAFLSVVGLYGLVAVWRAIIWGADRVVESRSQYYFVMGGLTLGLLVIPVGFIVDPDTVRSQLVVSKKTSQIFFYFFG